MHNDINRYRTKACYQRNMMWGQAIALLVVLIFVLFMTLLSQAPDEPSHSIFNDVRVNDPALLTPSQSKPARRNVSSRAQSVGEFHGQFGVKIKIIPDYEALPSPIAKPPKIYALDTTPYLIDEEISISEFDTGAYGAYVPYDGDYSYMPATAEPVNRPCDVLTKIDPDYPAVAIDARKEGEVLIIIPLDADGNKTIFSADIAQDFEAGGYHVYSRKFKVYGNQKKMFEAVIAFEEPTDWFFAGNLLKVLSQWTFTPTIENGMAVASYISIRCTYCLGDNCLRYEYDISRSVN